MITFILVVFSFSFILENLPREPVELKTNYLEPVSNEFVEYGAVPIFAENLRFSHNLISYTIDEGCDQGRRDDMIAAFNIFSNKVKIVSFFEDGTANADIKVGCSNEFIELSDELFAAGEGGPSRIINTSGFKVIEEGKIILYNGEDCRYPIVALHELLHVFGFDHSLDPRNIMYNTSSCDQRMSDDMVDVMVELYSIEALADALIESVEGVVHGRYLDFNISVLNEGLIGIDEIMLTILGDNETIDVVSLGEIGVGYGRTLRVENMRIKSGVEEVEFVLDAEGLIREISKENNRVVMRT